MNGQPLPLKSILFLFLTILVTAPASAGIIDAGFESNEPSAWQMLNLVSVVTSDFGVIPSEGAKQALLGTHDAGTSTDSSVLEAFLGLAPGTLTGSAGGSGLKQTFAARARQRLSFQWNFLSGEFLNTDRSFFTLNGVITPLASSESPEADTPTDTALGTLAGTGYRTYSVVIPLDGHYTLGFGIVNGGDDSVQSALLVDHVQIVDEAIPEPSTALLTVSALVTAVVARLRRG